jgi:hypothetical protein
MENEKKEWFWPWNNEFGWKKYRHSSNPGQNPVLYLYTFCVFCTQFSKEGIKATLNLPKSGKPTGFPTLSWIIPDTFVSPHLCTTVTEIDSCAKAASCPFPSEVLISLPFWNPGRSTRVVVWLVAWLLALGAQDGKQGIFGGAVVSVVHRGHCDSFYKFLAFPFRTTLVLLFNFCKRSMLEP